MSEYLTVEAVMEAIDPPPWSELNCASPPYGSPLGRRWDVLCRAAEAWAFEHLTGNIPAEPQEEGQ